MKRYIKADNASEYTSYITVNHGRQEFGVHINTDGPYPGSFKASMTEIHPYDDGDYAWAKIEFNGLTKFIRNGKVIDKMQLPCYEEDDYEYIGEYLDEMLDSVAVELKNINKDVKSRMVHW